MNPRRAVRALLALGFTLATTTSMFASGFSIFEQGAKATGMAGAFAATADDGSAMFYNVAGLAYQRKLGAYAGATVIQFQNEFRGDGDTFPGAGYVSGYEDHTFVPPNVYAVMPIGENMTFGFAQFSAFGLRTDWENGNQFAGRFISQDANLKTVSLQPSFAWKTSSGNFAVGAGIEYRTSHVTLERNSAAVNPFTQRIIDVAHVRIDSDWNNDIGYNVGVMFRPTDTWSFGAQYRSDMDIDYEGTADFTQIPTGNAQLDALIGLQLPPDQDVNTTIAFPAFYSIGVATKSIPNWTIEFDVTGASWSRFETLVVEFEDTPVANLEVEQNWEDTYALRLGAHRAITDRWDVYLGAVHDTNPQPLEGVGPLLPDADRTGITFGLGWHNEHWRIDVSDMILHFYDRNTMGQNRDNFNGEYHTSANLFALNLGYNF